MPTPADFAKRLIEACDLSDLIPPPNYGRLTELRRLLRERFDLDISVETVRKWFAGDAKPRADKMTKLAALLEVDEAWLSLGVSPDMTPRERKLRDATIDGSVNIVAGLIQMDGGHPAFPDPEDRKARAEHVDLTAIIKGAQYAFHVSLAKADEDGFHFVIPSRHESVVQLGVIYRDSFAITLVEIDEDLIAAGQHRGGAIEVVLGDKDVESHRIHTFTRRL